MAKPFPVKRGLAGGSGRTAWQGCRSSMAEAPDPGFFDVGILQGPGDRHLVEGEVFEPVPGQIAAPWIADEHGGAPPAQAHEPFGDPRRKVPLVADIAG